MKVILLKDVSKIGQRFDVKEVADGYALNFLIPRGLAKPATQAEIEKIKTQKITEENNKKTESENFRKKIESISSPILIEEKVNEVGHLFKGLHEADLAKALKEKTGLEIDQKFFKIERPIKEIGDFDVSIEGFGVKSKIRFSIVALK